MYEINKDDTINIVEGVGKQRVECTAILAGGDMLVQIVGGDKPHIGAVSMAVPRPSLKDPNDNSSTASVLTAVGHKDDEVARSASLYLAKVMSCVVVVVAGIHVCDADENDIKQILMNSDKVITELAEVLIKNRF